jgi:hypothetical protein
VFQKRDRVKSQHASYALAIRCHDNAAQRAFTPLSEPFARLIAARLVPQLSQQRREARGIGKPGITNRDLHR